MGFCRARWGIVWFGLVLFGLVFNFSEVKRMDYDIGKQFELLNYKLDLLLQVLSKGVENKPTTEKKE